MTKEWYKNNGYELSSLIDDSKISVAEEIVKKAYCEPLGITDESVIGILAFIYILQQNAFATRSGAKIKNAQFSTNATDANLVAYKKRAVLELTNYSADLSVVNDVCELFFVKQFFYE